MYQFDCEQLSLECLGFGGKGEIANAYFVHLALQDFAHCLRIADADFIVGDAHEFPYEYISAFQYFSDRLGGQTGKQGHTPFLMRIDCGSLRMLCEDLLQLPKQRE